MPFEKVIIGPRFNVRIEDLTAADQFVVNCLGCGRILPRRPAQLLARFPPYKRLLHLGEEFSCRSCRSSACEWHIERAVC